MPTQPLNIFDLGVDPTQNIPGMPLNFGSTLIPHALTFQATISSISRVYRASDEALKHSFENARLMTNDPVVEECTEIRRQACCLFDWHIEPGNKGDQGQVNAAKELTEIIKAIPRFIQYRENLLRATWYGKYAIEHKWGWKRIGNQMRMTVLEWTPVHGDKIVFRYDDGSLDFRPDQIGIRVGFPAQAWKNNFERWRKKSDVWERDELLKRIHERVSPIHSGKIQPTDYGLAYFLDTWERPLLAIHKHQIEDGEYEEPTNAGRIHGKGIRSVIYWAWLQKQEALALLMEYLERSAFGFNVAYYPAHNPQARDEIQDAVLKQSESGGSRNLIFFPVWQDDQANNYRIDHLEPSLGGVEALKSIIHEYFGHQIKRYILGQTLTSEAQATGLGSELANVHLGTFMQKVRYDAILEEETQTTDLLTLLIQYNFPEFTHAGFRFVVDTETPDAEERLAALKMGWEMGLKLRAQDVRDVLGTPVPEAGDEVLDMAANQAAMQPAGFGDTGKFAGNSDGGNGHLPNARPLEPESYTPGPTDSTDRDRLIASSDERPKAAVDVRGIVEALKKEFGRRGAFNGSAAA